MIKFNASIGVRGRYRAVVHTGHTYNDAGEIIKRGDVLRETPFGKNLILDQGFDRWFGRSFPSSSRYYMTCGPSNVPPASGDTVMGDAFGYASQTAGSIEKASNTDPLAGPLYRTIEHTRTFPPGSLGASSVNVSKAGIIWSLDSPNLAQVRAAPLMSAGLLVDSLGNPTSISVNPSEFLDIVWEVTFFVPYETVGVVVITVDGVPTNFDYTVRPQALWQVGGNPGKWASLSGAINFFDPVFTVFNSIYNDTTYRTTGVSNGSLVPVTTNVPALPIANTFTSVSAAAYVNGSKNRSFGVVLAPSQGNVSPDINRMNITLDGHNAVWQIAFSPGIPKTAAKQFAMNFNIALDNV